MPPQLSQAVANVHDPASAGFIPEDVWSVALNWFPNRHPLLTRFEHQHVGSDTFKFANEKFRPRRVLMTADVNNSATSITVDDSSIIEPDDVVKIENEYLLVTASAGTAPGALTVARGHAGTTAASHTAGSGLPVHLITNTRTGYQENVAPLSRTHEAFTQQTQTAMSAYAVGGSLQADTNYMGGGATPLVREKMAALQRVLDNLEVSFYRGRKVLRGNASAKPASAGLEQILTTNNFVAPPNYTAYKPSDFVRDAIQSIFDAGGEPTHMLVSTDFLSGFFAWGMPAVRTSPQETVLGIKIRRFAVPFLEEIEGVVAPLLPRGTVVVLSEPEVRIRMKREVFDKPRGSDGDAFRGDIIGEGAIEVDNEAHHAWVTGITGFAAPV
jgi:hypothetical protein